MGMIDVVFVVVEKIYIDDGIIMFDGKFDIFWVCLIVCFGYFDYVVINEIFEMRVFGFDVVV